MKLSVLNLALATGTVLGLIYFNATLFSLWTGTGNTIGYLQWIIPGFQRNTAGAFIGFVGGFVWGFILGGLVGWFYNLYHRMFEKS